MKKNYLFVYFIYYINKVNKERKFEKNEEKTPNKKKKKEESRHTFEKSKCVNVSVGVQRVAESSFKPRLNNNLLIK